MTLLVLKWRHQFLNFLIGNIFSLIFANCLRTKMWAETIDSNIDAEIILFTLETIAEAKWRIFFFFCSYLTQVVFVVSDNYKEIFKRNIFNDTSTKVLTVSKSYLKKIWRCREDFETLPCPNRVKKWSDKICLYLI